MKSKMIFFIVALFLNAFFSITSCDNGDKGSSTPPPGVSGSIQTIDRVNAVNISAAIDANNAIHVCYSHFNRGLKYATNKTGTWVSTYIQEEDVNTIVSVSGGDIAVDGNNNVHIVYSTSIDSDQGEGDLYYATNSSGSWIKTKIYVAPKGGIGPAGIAATSNGKAHIAFGDFDTNLKYLNNISGAWSSPIIVGSYWPSVFPRLALDSNNNIYIVYEYEYEYPLIRLQKVNSSGSLVSNTVLDGAKYDNSKKNNPNIAIDKTSNLVYVSYWWSDNANNNHLLKLYSAGGITTIDNCNMTLAGIAVDHNGKVYISFTDVGMNAALAKLKYATNKSGSWVMKELPTLPTSSNADIVIESTGKIDIIYATATSLSLISP